MTPFWWARRTLSPCNIWGRIVLRAPAMFFSVMLRGQCTVRSRVTYFEQVLCRGLWVDFDAVYIVFQHWLPVQTLREVLIFVARWRHNFREIAFENFEKSRNWRKSLCTRRRIDTWEICRKFHYSSLGPCIYIILFRRSLRSVVPNTSYGYCWNSY